MVRVGVALATLLLCAGSAVASSTSSTASPSMSVPTSLYFHIIGVQDFPINTQKPDDTWTDESSYGAATSTLTCLPAIPMVGATAQAYHTFYGYSSPGLVDYRMIQNGEPRIEAARGLGGDVHLDPSVPTTLHWFIAVGVGAPQGAPLPVPNVVLRTTWRVGDAISVDDVAYDSGTMIAQAQTDPVTLLGPQVITSSGAGSQQVKAVGQEGGLYIYEFTLPLKPAVDVIPQAEGFNVRVDMFLDNPACGGSGSVMPDEVAIYTSPQFRPRLELAVKDPLWVVTMTPRLVGRDLVVAAQVASAWGRYDLDVDKAAFTIAGPSEAKSIAPVPVLDPYEREANWWANPALMGWAWDTATDQPAGGHYTATLTVPDLQGTGHALASVGFEIGSPEKLPGVGVPMLLLGLALAAVVVARRRG